MHESKSMKPKTTELDLLFKEWENSNPNYKGSFKRDGIIDENNFSKASSKLLFIAKEPNDPKQKSGDYRTWWTEGLKYGFSHRIAEWSYGILNGFPQYDMIRKDNSLLEQAILDISFMNIKKIGGKGSSEKEEILRYLRADFEYIHKEIKIIEPEVIITSLSWNSVRNGLFPEIIWYESGYSIAIGKFNNSKVIDFYHPSSRTAPAASYSLLQNVMNSSSFREL